MVLEALEGVVTEKVLLPSCSASAVVVVRAAGVPGLVTITLPTAALASADLFAPPSDSLSDLILLIRIVVDLGQRQRTYEGLHPHSANGVKEVARP